MITLSLFQVPTTNRRAKNMSDTEQPTFWDELTSPVNLILVFFIVFLIYKIIKSKFETEDDGPPPPPPLPKIRKDLTVAEIHKYDGTQPDGRVLLAVNGVIFDVTKGKRFYGPGKWCYQLFTRTIGLTAIVKALRVHNNIDFIFTP